MKIAAERFSGEFQDREANGPSGRQIHDNMQLNIHFAGLAQK